MKIQFIILLVAFGMLSGGIGSAFLSSEQVSSTPCDCQTVIANQYATGLLPGGPRLPEPQIFRGNPPPQWDWRSATVNSITGDWTTHVKNQGNCGSCYAFGSLAAVESLINIVNEDPTIDKDLSEQFIVSCGREWVNGIDGCDGAYLSPTFDFLLEYGAIPESCFLYISGASGYVPPCSDKCDDWEDQVITVKGWNAIADDVESIKNALVAHGPLPTSMVVYSDLYEYSGGIYEHPGDDPNPSNHLVTIVGYDDTQQYWICKNSWGPSWGENGWFRIAYGDCHIEENTVYLEYEKQSDVRVTIEIHRIQRLDEIEGMLEGEADWSYRVAVNNGEQWSEAFNHGYSDGDDDHIETVRHHFSAFASNIPFSIKVWERDFWSADDLADASGYTGGGSDNAIDDLRGALFFGEYNLLTNELTDGDPTTIDDGYYVTSGEYSPDSSTGSDQNDVKVWFKITDTYDLPLPDLDASGSLNGTVEMGSTQVHLGAFTVTNIGVDPVGWTDTFLSWELAEEPSWGSNWVLDPDGGIDLPAGDSVTVDVYVDAPEEQGVFSGSLKIWNVEDHGDAVQIPIQLETPRQNGQELFDVFHLFSYKLFSYMLLLI